MTPSTPTSDATAVLNSTPALMAIVAAGTVGEVLLYLVPILLGSVVETFAIREGTAGLVMSLEIAVSAMAALTLSAIVHRIPCRMLTFGSMAVVLIGDAASAVVPTFELFIAARLLAAVGAGAIFAVASTMAAQRLNPEKTFALLSFSVIVAATVGYIAITFAISQFGPQAAFAALAVLSAVGLPFLFWFPDTVAEEHRKSPPALVLNRKFLALAVLTAIFILYLGQNALWAYVERIGSNLSLPLPVISQVLIANGILSLAGPVLAHKLNIRFGRLLPLVFAMAIQVVTALTLVYATELNLYAVSVVVLTTSFMFSIPYLKGLMAAVDPVGRVAGASAAMITVGGAIGPGIAGGALNAGATYKTIGWFTVCAILVTTVLAIIVARWADARSCEQPVPSPHP